jgi:cytoskeletal protein CcmA (bactofilin family)
MTGVEAPSVLGRDTTVKGHVSGAEELVVEGRVEGHVTLKAHLVVEHGASVHAQVQVDALTVRGALTGSVRARDWVLLASSAEVEAELVAPRIVVEEGARFRGRVEMDVVLPPDP